jgi:hypothetical protein
VSASPRMDSESRCRFHDHSLTAIIERSLQVEPIVWFGSTKPMTQTRSRASTTITRMQSRRCHVRSVGRALYQDGHADCENVELQPGDVVA